jgi:hypothetical protein
MTKIKGVMMSSEAIEPAGFVSQFKLDSTQSKIVDFIDVDSNDNIYLGSSMYAYVDGVNTPGQTFAKVDSDPTSENFGLLSNIKMHKVTTWYGSMQQAFCVSGSNIHSAHVNWQYPNGQASANQRNYSTHFKTDLDFNNLSTLNSWHLNATSAWGPSSQSFSKIVADSSGGAYLGAIVNQGTTWGQRGTGVVKVNSSGSQQWKRFVIGTSDGTYKVRNLQSIDVNSNDYSAWGSWAEGSGTGVNDSSVIGLFNSSGTQQFLKLLTKGNRLQVRGVHVDSSQNVYIAATGSVNYEYIRPVIIKLNSSGVHQWTRKLSVTLPTSTTSAGWQAHIYAHNIAVHGSDIYCYCTYTESDPRNNIYSLDNRIGILKLDTSGNFGYYREITDNRTDNRDFLAQGNNSTQQQFITDSQGNLILGFNDFRSSAWINYLMKIPQSKAQSGGFTGTYHGYIEVNALSGSLISETTSVSDWPVASTTSLYALNGSAASLSTGSVATTTNNTSYLY